MKLQEQRRRSSKYLLSGYSVPGTSIGGRCYYYSHFMNENTEAYRFKMHGDGSHNIGLEESEQEQNGLVV